jgi:hypothetical protein
MSLKRKLNFKIYNMKSIKICLLLLALGIAEKSWSQDLLNTITKSETERIEKYLSSDELEGRKTFSKGIDKAAAFIANEFAQAGLATFKNSGTYLHGVKIALILRDMKKQIWVPFYKRI